MCLLGGIPLVLYGAHSITLFRQDKLAYIFSNGSDILNSKSVLLKKNLQEIDALLLQLQEKALAGTLWSEKERLFGQGVDYFSTASETSDSLPVAWPPDYQLKKRLELSNDCQKRSLNLCLRIFDPEADLVFVAVKRKSGEGHSTRSEAVLRRPDLMSVLHAQGTSLDLLAESEVLAWLENQGLNVQRWIDARNERLQFWVYQEGDQILTFSSVGIEGLYLVSRRSVSESMQVVKQVALQSIFFLIGAVGAILILAVLITSRLTAGIQKLTEATRFISEGNFDTRLKTEGRDEIGTLSKAFNLMSEKIAELLIETREKARMSAELATAQTVQATLYPEPRHESESYSILASYRTASECGGDFWSYFEDDENLYFFAGDVTGHGVPAALITASARAAVTTLRTAPPKTLSEALARINLVVYECSRGGMWMTFFIGRLEKSTGKLRFANASHTQPFVLRLDKNKKTQFDQLEYLYVKPGAILGSNVQSSYLEAEAMLKSGDILVLYTDGYPEAKTSSGRQYGSLFERTLVKAWNAAGTLEETMSFFEEEFSKFTEGAPLDDDAMICFIQRKS